LSLRLLREGCSNVYVPFDLVNEVGKRETVQEAGMKANYQRGQAIFMARHGAFIRNQPPSARMLWALSDHLECV
jgi:hypothetical protein